MVSSSHLYFSVLRESAKELPNLSSAHSSNESNSQMSETFDKMSEKMSDRMSPPSQLMDLSLKKTGVPNGISQSLVCNKLMKFEKICLPTFPPPLPRSPPSPSPAPQQLQQQHQQQQQQQQRIKNEQFSPTFMRTSTTTTSATTAATTSPSSPKRNENLSFGVDRLLGKSSIEKNESSSKAMEPSLLEFPPTSISLATSLASFGPSVVSNLRPMGIFANHPSQLMHHPSLSFRPMHVPPMMSPHQPTQSYLQGLYSQSILLGQLRHHSDLYHGPSGVNFHSSLHPHHLGAVLGTGKRKKSWTRAVFSHLQRKGLEKRFQVQKYITKPDRRQLAASLGLTDAQVKVWFQNRRMKWRHQEMKQRREQERAATTAANSSKAEPSSHASISAVPNPIQNSGLIPSHHVPTDYRYTSPQSFESPPDSPMSGDSGSEEFDDVTNDGRRMTPDSDDDEPCDEIKVD